MGKDFLLTTPNTLNTKTNSPFQAVSILSSRCGLGRLALASYRICLALASASAQSASPKPNSCPVSSTVQCSINTFWFLSSSWGSWGWKDKNLHLFYPINLTIFLYTSCRAIHNSGIYFNIKGIRYLTPRNINTIQLIPNFTTFPYYNTFIYIFLLVFHTSCYILQSFIYFFNL